MHGLRQRPISDFGALLTHIRELRAEIARLTSRIEALEDHPASFTPPAIVPRRLHEAVSEHFNLAELRALGAALDVDTEKLQGDGLDDLSLALILYMRRRGRLKALLLELQQQRPHIEWENYK